MVDGNTNVLLEDEIRSQIEGISSLSADIEQQQKAIDNVVKLYKLKIDEDKNNLEADEKYSRRLLEEKQHEADLLAKEKQLAEEMKLREREVALRERELAIKESEAVLKVRQQDTDEIFKEQQLIESKKDRYVKIGMEGAAIILPMMFYGIWMKKGFEFEKTGNIVSSTFKGLIKHFKPTKK